MSVSCAVALVLLLDSSSSVTADDWRSMVEGHADALVSPAVVRVIEMEGGLAVSAIGFDDRTTMIQPWRVLRTEGEAERMGKALLDGLRPSNGSTLIGQALQAALAVAREAPCGDRVVVDIVTDGEAPDAAETGLVRDAAADAGVTINALGVGRPAMEWLRQHAVTPGGFVVEAPTWAEFNQSMRRKLVRETAGLEGTP